MNPRAPAGAFIFLVFAVIRGEKKKTGTGPWWDLHVAVWGVFARPVHLVELGALYTLWMAVSCLVLRSPRPILRTSRDPYLWGEGISFPYVYRHAVFAIGCMYSTYSLLCPPNRFPDSSSRFPHPISEGPGRCFTVAFHGAQIRT